ncbi:3-beta hydroxysteroid dehydrogenase isomerase [Diplodia corticola]|uniref:3-beta hydroxysteroid dehydrogenase isomerase n=1 Tax=Diplodia corticola TaxID=236234 RepID=A0A1J9R871_9PEZI|nr:3-beta hydroxysteroid dehydrogenase isomerase [Diplodia corticola]OJD36784.1 3-beta hydroxysteroid dehydrogenase isomerase [Diplodia corticola]
MYPADLVVRFFSPSTYAICISAVLLFLYLRHVDRALSGTPDEADRAGSRPWTVEELKETYQRMKQSPVDIRQHLPPKQSRRYIVTGGAGLVGGSIVQHLLARGEDPDAIRIVDVRRPTPDVAGDVRRSAELSKVSFASADITNIDSTNHAFSLPWPSSVADRPLTVFHTAATIRFAERARDLLPLSEAVNVVGTENVLAAAKAANSSVLIATSSGSIAIRRVNFWLVPWQRWPRGFFQSLSDADYDLTRPHETYFGNYPASKATAERLVRGADDAAAGFRTGVIRPASGVYGSTTDNTIGNYLRRGGNADWIRHIVNPFVYTENVSLAHLLLERHLISPARRRTPTPTPAPSTITGQPIQQQQQQQPAAAAAVVDLGGRAFTVTDPNPPIRYADMATLLHALSATPVRFVAVPPAPMLVVAHAVEFYSLLRHRYRLAAILPPLAGDLALLQPALFAICCVHLAYDDGEARKSPEDGGLGYRAPWTSMEAMCAQVLAWNEDQGEKGGGGGGGVVGEVRDVIRVVERLSVAPGGSS